MSFRSILLRFIILFAIILCAVLSRRIQDLVAHDIELDDDWEGEIYFHDSESEQDELFASEDGTKRQVSYPALVWLIHACSICIKLDDLLAEINEERDFLVRDNFLTKRSPARSLQCPRCGSYAIDPITRTCRRCFLNRPQPPQQAQLGTTTPISATEPQQRAQTLHEQVPVMPQQQRQYGPSRQYTPGPEHTDLTPQKRARLQAKLQRLVPLPPELQYRQIGPGGKSNDAQPSFQQQTRSGLEPLPRGEAQLTPAEQQRIASFRRSWLSPEQARLNRFLQKIPLSSRAQYQATGRIPKAFGEAGRVGRAQLTPSESWVTPEAARKNSAESMKVFQRFQKHIGKRSGKKESGGRNGGRKQGNRRKGGRD